MSPAAAGGRCSPNPNGPWVGDGEEGEMVLGVSMWLGIGRAGGNIKEWHSFRSYPEVLWAFWSVHFGKQRKSSGSSSFGAFAASRPSSAFATRRETTTVHSRCSRP
jgi:hypothetical protein